MTGGEPEPEAVLGRIQRALSGRTDAMLETVRELVEINSFTRNVEGGNRVAALLQRRLEEIDGVTVRCFPSERYASHVVASTGAARAAPQECIALVGHLDTVFAPGSFEGFSREGDTARGPGVLDMKGGLAVVIEALRCLAAAGVLDDVAARFVIVSDEEIGSPEGRPLIQREVVGARAALVFEAGREHDRVITARKGTGVVVATATGRAAHAGDAHAQGANAIWALARFVDAAQALTDYSRGVTVNVGTISGGQSKNTVPDRAEAVVDYRFESTASGEETTGALHALAARAAAEVSGTRVEVSGGIARTPLERTTANVALYHAYAACAAAAGLGDGEASRQGGGSDASSTAAIGVPSIDGLGPRGSGLHTKEERIEISSLLPKAEALARFLLGSRPHRR